VCFLSTGVQHELELQHIDWGLGAVSSSRKNSGMNRGRRARHAAENAPLTVGLILSLFRGACLGVYLMVQVVFNECMVTSSCHGCLEDHYGCLPLAGLPLNQTWGCCNKKCVPIVRAFVKTLSTHCALAYDVVVACLNGIASRQAGYHAEGFASL
jgi:hypothetical protein